MSAFHATESSPVSDVRGCLDSIQKRLQTGYVDKGMSELFTVLRSWRNDPPNGEWDETAEQVLSHSVREVVFQDPLTHYSHRQPRGYPGDAELLDFIYGLGRIYEEKTMTPLGGAIHHFVWRARAAKGVRARRGILADLIDRVAESVRHPRILSVACGHLREAELSRALQTGRVDEFVAFDQDEQSLRRIEEDYARLGIDIVQGSVLDLLKGKTRFENFDCVYAAGLYDYLQQKTAKRLTRLLFDSLRAGGRMLIANFLPDIADVGFMESFMGWKLIYRDRVEFLDVTAEIPLSDVGDISMYAEPNQQILFIEIQKR